MKSIKKSLLYIFLLMVMLLAIPTQASAAVKISKKSVTLIKGQTTTLKVTGTKNKVTWSSSKKSVATVTTKGKITAKKKGTATITAKIGNKKYTCKVKVETPKLSKSSLILTKGKTATLKVSGTSQKITWKSSNKKIATVTSKGVVKGVNAGDCKITATVCGKKYTCTVTVKKQVIPVEDFSINQYYITIKEGETQQISPYFYPENATDKTVKWTSSNSTVASVDSNGVVTGKSMGEVVITAICNGLTATCDVEVKRNFIEQDAVQSLSYTAYDIDGGRLLFIKNNYKYPMELWVECLFYNSNGVLIAKRDDMHCDILESGRECVIANWNALDSNADDIQYSSYKLNFRASEPYDEGNASMISCQGHYGVDNVMVTVKNNDNVEAFPTIAIVFYKGGKIVGYDYDIVGRIMPNITQNIQFGFPYDSKFQTIIPDNFKLYVNSSYKY